MLDRWMRNDLAADVNKQLTNNGITNAKGNPITTYSQLEKAQIRYANDPEKSEQIQNILSKVGKKQEELLNSIASIEKEHAETIRLISKYEKEEMKAIIPTATPVVNGQPVQVVANGSTAVQGTNEPDTNSTKEQEEVADLQKRLLLNVGQIKNVVEADKLAKATANGVEVSKPANPMEAAKKNPASYAQLQQDTNKQSKSIGNLVKNVSLYAVALRTLRSAAREASRTISELDKSLTEQSMVTGKSRDEVYKLLTSYQELAKTLGATTKEVAQVATEYMRQGKTTQEALTLTQAAVSAAKVASISASDSINYLTTALNGFQLSANDAMAVSDKFAAVAAKSATSYNELAVALSKVASQANLAGFGIDYTTALLAKGLETTREAPETIGTALKTIIARMRELSDYGKTLGGDTDINNVESQLKFIGIALRDTNGELRSTEVVLDELGRKWDTLNSNQQAAIAKALAGTRQQSRLIAMMTDYERVIELEEISKRSAGSTLAQMDSYLQSIESATNSVKVAWEEIVTAFANSEFLVNFINTFAKALGTLNKALTFTGDGWEKFLGGAMYFTAAYKGLGVVSKKVVEMNDHNQQNQSKKSDALSAIESAKANFKQKTNDGNSLVKSEGQKQAELKLKEAELEVDKAKNEQAIINGKIDKNNYEIEKEILVIKMKQLEVDKAKEEVERKGTTTFNIAKANADIAKSENNVKGIKQDNLNLNKQLAQTNEDIAKAEAKVDEAQKKVYAEKEKNFNEQLKKDSEYAEAQKVYNGLLMQTNTLFAIQAGAITVITMLQQGLAVAKGIVAGVSVLLNKTTIDNIKNTEKDTVVTVANTIAKMGLAGAIIAAVAATAALVVGLGFLVMSMVDTCSSVEKAAAEVNKLSAEIFKLNKKATALDKIIDSFDAIDNKVIKTNKDLKEMSTLLESAADSLDTNVDEKSGPYGDQSEKDFYLSLQSDRAKYDFLVKRRDEAQKAADTKRNEQIKTIRGLNEKERAELFAGTDANSVKAKDAVYALGNDLLYKRIDALKETEYMSQASAAAIEDLTTSLLDQMSAEEAWQYVNNPDKMKSLVDMIKGATVTINNMNMQAAEILGSETYALKDQLKAYKQIEAALQKDKVALEEFTNTWSQFDKFGKLGDDVLDFIDKTNLSIDKIDELYKGYEKLNHTGLIRIGREEYENRADQFLQSMADFNGDVVKATQAAFGDLLEGLKGEELETAWNAMIKNFGDLVAVGILNMGQNIDSLENTIDDFYKKASEWGKMSESDKTSFLSDHADLFQGESGAELLKAFETGNYDVIESALKHNTALQEQLQRRREEVNRELQIEEARVGDARNESYIKQLREYKAMLDNQNSLFKASLEVRLEQENKQIEAYKSVLQKQHDALVESLNKRKEAYQEYFDAINQNQEDEDYDKQASILQDNLSKLGSSTDANAVKQTKELETQLKDLEEERLKTLRERAQEQVIENMDDELEQINDKFDKLINSSQAILNEMIKAQNDDGANFIADLIATKVSDEGLTALGYKSFVNELESIFASKMPDFDWSALGNVSNSTTNANNLVLNISGEEVELNPSDKNALVDTILKALKELGLK